MKALATRALLLTAALRRWQVNMRGMSGARGQGGASGSSWPFWQARSDNGVQAMAYNVRSRFQPGLTPAVRPPNDVLTL